MSDVSVSTSLVTMTEDECWALVDKIGWGNNYKKMDSSIVKYRLMDTLRTIEKCDFFHDWVHAKAGKLYRVLDTWQRDNNKNFGLGDDSFGDLVSHIVGCGKEIYETVLANPKSGYARAHSGDFGECFSYCIPSKHTFADLRRLPSRKQELNGEMARLTRDVPVFTDLFWEVNSITNQTGLLESSHEADLKFKELEEQANKISESFVGTKEQHRQLEEARQFFSSWSHRNYVGDCVCVNVARKLGPL